MATFRKRFSLCYKNIIKYYEYLITGSILTLSILSKAHGIAIGAFRVCPNPLLVLVKKNKKGAAADAWFKKIVIRL